MKLGYKYRPIVFYFMIFLCTWIPGFVAAYCSYQGGMEWAQVLLLLGLVAPCAVAISMIYSSKSTVLKADFWDRLSLYKIKLKYLPIIFLLMPCVVFLATAISLLFGQPFSQFYLAPEWDVVSGHSMFSLFILFLAPTLEEIGWRGYGVDSLRANFNLFKTSMLFACLWGMWHLPLFFVKGYYQNTLLSMGIIYVANFFISCFPASFLMNWVYYKNNRSIVAVILLHFVFNVFSLICQTEQFTKCIITILLSAISIVIVARNRKLFFNF